jgi:hypothetical protein
MMNYLGIIVAILLTIMIVQLYKNQTVFYLENFDSSPNYPDWRERQIVAKNNKVLNEWNHKDLMFNTITSKFGRLNLNPFNDVEGVYL